MADMNFQLVLQAIVKGQEALDKVVKAEEQIAKAAKAANDAQAAGAGKAESAMRREAEASQRAATAARALGTATHAAASGNSQQAASAERVASAETRAASATKAHAAAATMQAKAVHTAARAQTSAAAGVAAGAAAAKATARKEMLVAAATQATPSGYLLGSSGAVIAGTLIGGAVAGAGVAAAIGFKQAVSFEKAMADVKKKINLPDGAKWADVERMINRSAVAYGIQREEVAALAAQAGGSGIAFKDMAGFIDLAARAAAGWDMTASQSADRLANVVAQTRWGNAALSDFADKVNYLADTGKAREPDILNMFGRAADAAKAANVPLDTTMAAVSAMNSAGMAPEIAARAWGSMTAKLATAAKAGRGAKDVAEGLKMIGLSAKAVEAGMKTDATKTIFDLFDRLAKAKDPIGAALRIFGRDYATAALRTAQVQPDMERRLAGLNSGAWKGSLDKNLQLDLDTTAKQMERLSALTSQILDNMGRWALPPINAGLKALIDLGDGGVSKWWNEKVVGGWSRVGRNALGGVTSSVSTFWDKYTGAPGAFAPPAASRVNAPIPKAPPKSMFQQIEGATPHIDVKQIDQAVADGVAKASKLHDALETLNMTVTPNVNAGPAIQQLQTLTSVAQSARAALTALGASGPGTAPAFAAPAAPGIGKQSGLAPTGIIKSAGGVQRTHVAHGGTTVHYAPTIHAASGADRQQIARLLDDHAERLERRMAENDRRRRALSFREVG